MKGEGKENNRFKDRGYGALIGLLLFLGAMIFLAKINGGIGGIKEPQQQITSNLIIKYGLQSENTLLLKNLTQVVDLCQCKNYCTECTTKLVINNIP